MDSCTIISLLSFFVTLRGYPHTKVGMNRCGTLWCAYAWCYGNPLVCMYVCALVFVQGCGDIVLVRVRVQGIASLLLIQAVHNHLI